MKRIVLLTVLLLLIMPKTASGEPRSLNLRIEYLDTSESEVIAFTVAHDLNDLSVTTELVPRSLDYIISALSNTNMTWDILITETGSDDPYRPTKFIDEYSCGGNDLGYNLFNTCDYGFNQSLVQSSVAQGNLLSQGDVDRMLIEIENEYNETQRIQLFDEFRMIFMTQLLYEVPLYSESERFIISSGMNWFNPLSKVYTHTPSSRVLDPLKEVLKGAYWGDYVNPRYHDNGTLALPIAASKLDWEYFFQNPSRASIIFPTLGFFDSVGGIHPNTAMNYSIGSSDDVWNLEIHVREDVEWVNASTGDLLTGYRVKAGDFALGIKLMESRGYLDELLNVTFSGELLSVEMSQGYNWLQLFEVPAIPYWYLGGDLHLENGSVFRAFQDGVGSGYLDYSALVKTRLSIEDSIEWGIFSKSPIQAGPYYLNTSDPLVYVPGSSAELVANPYYWFPNEDDGDFDLMTQSVEDPYFFAYNGTDRVNSLRIPRLKYIGYNDTTVEEEKLMQGEVDISRRLSDDLYGLDWREFTERYSVFVSLLPSSGYRLLFNLGSPDVQNYDTRRGIVHAIDKAGIYAQSVTRVAKDSPVPSYYVRYYSDDWKVDFDQINADLLLPGTTSTWDTVTSSSPAVPSNISLSMADTSSSTRVLFLHSGSIFSISLLVHIKRRSRLSL